MEAFLAVLFSFGLPAIFLGVIVYWDYRNKALKIRAQNGDAKEQQRECKFLKMIELD